MMVLVPDEQLGVFMATNSTGGVDAVTQVMDGFFDRFAPATGSPGASAPAGSDPAAVRDQRSGFYQPARHNESTVERVLSLTDQARLRVDPSGRLLFKSKTWAPAGPGLYQEVGGTGRMSFVDRDSGSYLVTDGPTYQRVPRADTVTVNLVVLLLIVLSGLSAVLGLPLAAAVRRVRRRPSSASRSWRRARRLAGLAAGIGLLFLGLFVVTLLGDTSAFLDAVPASFRLLLVLPVLSAVLAVASAGLTVTAWRSGPIAVRARAHQAVVLTGLLALIWFGWHWNLLGWQFG
jgi:hypothetical protein